MSLSVTKENYTLTILWPSSCGGWLNGERMMFVVVVEDVENCYRMLTAPLSAQSPVMRVAIPPYFCHSADQLFVTVHLCRALVNEVGWKTVESLTACAIPSDNEEFAWQWQQDQSDCEHGPTGRRVE